jgi:hypothetical protein
MNQIPKPTPLCMHFHIFSKSIHVCCSRNSNSQTSFIGLTKYLKHMKVVAFPILL